MLESVAVSLLNKYGGGDVRGRAREGVLTEAAAG
jgi:hypothetical protein